MRELFLLLKTCPTQRQRLIAFVCMCGASSLKRAFPSYDGFPTLIPGSIYIKVVAGPGPTTTVCNHQIYAQALPNLPISSGYMKL